MVSWVVKKSKLSQENSSIDSTELRSLNRSITPEAELGCPTGNKEFPTHGD